MLTSHLPSAWSLAQNNMNQVLLEGIPNHTKQHVLRFGLLGVAKSQWSIFLSIIAANQEML